MIFFVIFVVFPWVLFGCVLRRIMVRRKKEAFGDAPIIVPKTLNLVAYLRMYLVMYFTLNDWL